MDNNITPLDVLRCAKNPPVKVGNAILPAWVLNDLKCNPMPLLEECVILGYLEKRDHSHDRIPGSPSYNITQKGLDLLLGK